MDYYVVLGIAEDADEETIRSAFRALARRYHPDVGAGSSPAQFQRAREAYETLVDPERRRQYDYHLRASRPQPILVREVIVSRPLAEPLFSSRRDPFRVAENLAAPRYAPFDELMEELVAYFGHEWLLRRRRW
jgi:curved DNA-binding protein CbpA